MAELPGVMEPGDEIADGALEGVATRGVVATGDAAGDGEQAVAKAAKTVSAIPAAKNHGMRSP